MVRLINAIGVSSNNQIRKLDQILKTHNPDHNVKIFTFAFLLEYYSIVEDEDFL